MKTLLIAIGLVTAFAVSANAQGTMTTSSTATAAAVVSKDCLMQADASTWKTLGLNPDQIKRMDDIKARHEKECMAMGEAEKTMDAAKCKHEDEVKAVLTSAQYTRWQEWCKTHESSEGSMEKQPEKKTTY